MRICSIITSFTSGGAEMLVCNLAEAFAQAGHQATVLSLSDAAQVGNAPDTEAAMMARVRADGATALSLGLANRNNLPGGALALRRALRAIRPDVIHAHTARALFPLALAMPGVPVVLTHHNSRLSFPPSAFVLFDCIVDGYVAISDQCEAMLRDHARKPIRMILNAASARFQAGRPRDAAGRDPTILAVGTVSAQKDYPTLLRAARPLVEALAAQGRSARIRIAGGGPEFGRLQVQAAGEPVELLGACSGVDALMRQADLFVNCSLWEGFPIAMIEAAMSGLPIVATAVAGNREMVLPGVNGRLVPPSDPAALARAVVETLSDDSQYAALSRGALHAARRFSLESCAAAHLDLYRELTQSRRPRFAPSPLARPVSPCE
ncbi:glycosyl transferase [Sphingobium indicum IP26]|uniref:Glycosyl transferase n=1 Tax=Sphingobium indicum F2 TaxID=1450518 RepID=A0A8E0WSP6_9SPHN|nr:MULTISPECIES: glycosyltransferase family 4 protein [Sphingobium]EPR18909.1 glycosyl transferase [Sphingobium indicum IP26]EQB00198.1 glycosyl transferase [Sphingobium sp. HDIP04]KER36495.1 glycosyl transferase [Sphingobium indicum F2]